MKVCTTSEERVQVISTEKRMRCYRALETAANWQEESHSAATGCGLAGKEPNHVHPSSNHFKEKLKAPMSGKCPDMLSGHYYIAVPFGELLNLSLA